MCDYYFFFFLYRGFNMASSSSSNYYYDVTSGPLEDGLLWMKKNHISQHIWNCVNERRLKIRRATLIIEKHRPTKQRFHSANETEEERFYREEGSVKLATTSGRAWQTTTSSPCPNSPVT